MKQAPQEVAPGIWRLVLPMPRGFMRSVNLYLIRDRDGYVLVDSGLDAPESWSALSEQLDLLGIPIPEMHTVVVTHAHLDHYGQAGRLRERGAGQVWLHERDREFMRYRYLDGDFYHRLWSDWLRRYGLPEPEAVKLTTSIEQSRRETPLVAPDRPIQGHERLAIGDYVFEVLWTPGHTPGHICLYEPQQHLLLSGDHVLEHVAPNVSLQPYPNENPLPGYLESLDQVARLAVDLVLPGHDEPFVDLAERVHELVSHQMERRALLLALLTSRPQTAYELARKVWADTSPLKWSQFRGFLRRNAVGTLAAHLEQLASEGLVTRHEDPAVAFTLRS